MTAQVLPSPYKKEAQVFPRVSWQQYEDIDRAFETVAGVKFRYLDGFLETMAVSSKHKDLHEDFKSIIRMLLEAYLRVKGIRFYGRGAPSLGSLRARRSQ